MTAAQYAQRLISAHGWKWAYAMAAAEASRHSPSGNHDGFWTAVKAVIEKEGRIQLKSAGAKRER